MDGAHDLGGKEGFGPIDVNERLDWWRHVRELIEPADYLTRPYFDQWMQTQTATMPDSGILTLEEIASGNGVPAPRVTGSPMQRSAVLDTVASFVKDYSRRIDVPPTLLRVTECVRD
jgi:nitrile hydratase